MKRTQQLVAPRRVWMPGPLPKHPVPAALIARITAAKADLAAATDALRSAWARIESVVISERAADAIGPAYVMEDSATPVLKRQLHRAMEWESKAKALVLRLEREIEHARNASANPPAARRPASNAGDGDRVSPIGSGSL